MIKNKQDLRNYIAQDEKRFGYRKPNIYDWVVNNENYYIWHFIHELRYVEYYKNIGNKFLYALHFFRFKRLSWKLHFTMYPGTIGPGLMIFHVGSFIHVGRNVQIGENCTILPGVVFGNKTQECKNQPITVGDNCYFGLDSKIFGPVRIGNNVTIGANSVVTKNIEDNCVVGGVPAKVIKKAYD